jgi:hypothetical protein
MSLSEDASNLVRAGVLLVRAVDLLAWPDEVSAVYVEEHSRWRTDRFQYWLEQKATRRSLAKLKISSQQARVQLLETMAIMDQSRKRKELRMKRLERKTSVEGRSQASSPGTRSPPSESRANAARTSHDSDEEFERKQEMQRDAAIALQRWFRRILAARRDAAILSLQGRLLELSTLLEVPAPGIDQVERKEYL